MTRWEYRVVRFPADWFRNMNVTKRPDWTTQVEETLNALGAQGWEAVNLSVADYNGRVLLKRPKP